MAIAVPFTGGCACGAIRYECSAEPLMSWKCHCRDCQRATGWDYMHPECPKYERELPEEDIPKLLAARVAPR